MPFVRAADLVVHYELSGAPGAPVLVLANSLGTSLAMWESALPLLAGAHRVLRYDLRGHGLTSCTPGVDPPAATIARRCEDLVALLDALGIGRVRFAGVSIGGMVGQRFGAEHPERVEALALCATSNVIGPASRWDQRIQAVNAGGLAAIADGVVGGWFTERMRREEPDVVAGFATMLQRTPVEGYVEGCRAVRDADLRADDARIRARTLVVSGAEDPTTTPERGAELARAIPGARCAVVDGAAHIIPAEQPAALARTLLDFFGS